MEATKIIAKFVVESSYADIPGKVRHEATRTVLNWVGCAVGGCRHETIECALHPGGPVASALLAFAGHRPMSGADIMHAFILGVEVERRIGNAVYPSHYDVGWHITGTAGVFGAAAAGRPDSKAKTGSATGPTIRLGPHSPKRSNCVEVRRSRTMQDSNHHRESEIFSGHRAIDRVQGRR